MKHTDNLPIIAFETQQDWEAWLEEHHTNTKGIWLKLAKKDTGIASVSYAEALEGALCYGWIDGQKASCDEQYWLQKFTSRSPKSMWSMVNCGYESQRKITVPADFQSALDKNQQARDCFNTLNSVNRYAILFRIQTAKKPETRSARIQKCIEMLTNEQKLYP